MQTSKVLRASPAFSALRSFSTSSAHNRAPSIRDITPTNASEFDARQKEFRQSLEEARKKRQEQESQSVANTLRDRAREFCLDSHCSVCEQCEWLYSMIDSGVLFLEFKWWSGLTYV